VSPQPTAQGSPHSPEPAASALPASVTGTVPLTVGRIELVRGNVQYSDFYIRPNYSANLTDVNGSISAMSATQAGNVSIAAKVDGSAPVEISGRMNPLAHDLTLDLAGKAHDIDLPPLSAYSAKYAGYGITKGKLSFDVSYKVENRKLSADNRIVLDQLTFGEHVDSPTATKLPVLLAVALLKDVHGVIDIDLPVQGSLDDPQFSVGGLIVKVIVNLLTKAVTAPFALLGAAFGGGEELSMIDFKPGMAALDPAADAKIDKLAKALTARPALRLDIGGHTDTATDSEALRRAAVEDALRAEKVKALAASGTSVSDAATITVSADERAKYLLAAYKDAPIKERPRNFIGLLKDVPAADMESMLYDHASVSADMLANLATRRAEAVKEALVKRGVATERLFIVTGKSAGKPREGSGTRVDLALK
jgi:outer membrane protein OmpA-like peptidoglycan-associated protein